MDTPALALSIVFFSLSLGLLFACAVMLRVVRRIMKKAGVV
jgi:hypothetical protein